MAARRIRSPATPRVTVSLDGSPIAAFEGEPLAAALMAAGVAIFGRSSKYHRPRGAPCGDGHCAHCLMRVDGRPNVATCMVPCHDGLEASRQNVVGGAEHDLLGATDWLFPRGLDHHEMFTGVPLVQPVVQKVVRKLSGLGRLPDAPLDAGAAADEEAEVLVVGGGISGLAAARAAAAEGARVRLFERRPALGGRTGTGLFADADAEPPAGATVTTFAAAVQLEGAPGARLVVVDGPKGLVRVLPRATVIAAGGYPGLGLFEGNDLPGVLDLAWAARLLAHGVLPGERAIVCADGAPGDAFAAAFTAAGGTVALRLPASAALGPAAPEGTPRLTGVLGAREVRSARLAGADHKAMACDLVVVGLPPSPAFELAAQAGATVGWDTALGAFVVRAGEDGRLADDLFACGTVIGHTGARESAASGEAAGRAAARAAASARKGAARAP